MSEEPIDVVVRLDDAALKRLTDELARALRQERTHGGQWCGALVSLYDLRAALDELAAARKALSVKDRALLQAARKFREYQASHAAKHTADGDVKSQTNRMMAEICEEAAPPPPQENKP